jgi:hypothetical protein
VISGGGEADIRLHHRVRRRIESRRLRLAALT